MTSKEELLGGRAMRDGSDALVRRAQAGDAAAYEALVRPRMQALLRLAQSILGNEHDAHDAVQESCLRAWQEVPRLREPDRFEAWLWRIVINACRSALRGRRRATVREIAVGLIPKWRLHAARAALERALEVERR